MKFREVFFTMFSFGAALYKKECSIGTDHYGRETTSSRECEKRYLGKAEVVQKINSNYSVIKSNTDVVVSEGLYVE